MDEILPIKNAEFIKEFIMALMKIFKSALRLLLLLMLFPAFLPAIPYSIDQQDQTVSARDSITIEELKEHVYYLASDELGGRAIGTAGYEAAVRYAVHELRTAGLCPLFADKDGEHSYLQTVPFMRPMSGDVGKLSIRTPEGAMEFAGGEQFKFLRFRDEGFLGRELSVVFVGYGIEESRCGWNDYADLDIEGKLAVMLPGVPLLDGRAVLPERLHRFYSGGEGEARKMEALFKRRPAALMLLADDSRSENWGTLRNAVERTRVIYLGGDRPEAGNSRPLSARKRGAQLLVRGDLLTALFQGQKYSPAEIPEIGIEGYKTFRLKETSVKFDFNEPGERFVSWNAAGWVEGKDPELKNQFITVGAHLDHVLPRNGQICNGADDNASGSAGVLEIAEALALHPPRRSVIFILYTGEESGLCGSRYFIKECPVPLEEILVNVNLDMIGRTSDSFRESRAHYVYGAAEVRPELQDLVAAVNGDPPIWPLKFLPQDQAPGGSDHLSYMAQGIPGVFFCSGRHPDVHTPADDADKIEYDKMQKLSQLIYALVMELANQAPSPFTGR